MSTAPRERPILFSGPMVRAILGNRKTVTRRIVRNPGRLEGFMLSGEEPSWCPYGGPGDLLWVRETFRQAYRSAEYHYRADADEPEATGCWRPSIFMPRAACRLFLGVVSVRAERLQDITEEDVEAEGLSAVTKDAFAHGWDKINSKRGPWASNPMVWRVEFRRGNRAASNVMG